MRVAAVQMSSQDRVMDNLARAERLIEEAAHRGAGLVCLPEGFAYLGPDRRRRDHAEERGADGPVQKALSRWAGQHGIHLLAGGMPIVSSDPEKPYNSSLLYGPNGVLLASYDKLHLFDVALDDGTVLEESEATMAGSAVVVTELPGVRLGLSICYDLRFPQLFQEQRERGAELCAVTAAFTQTTGEAHWHVLLRARAIETQCFVVAAAQVGAHGPSRRTFGHSLLIDAWGRVLAELPTGEGVVLAELDLEQLRSVRRQMPLWEHRRPLGPGGVQGRGDQR
jgi:predicted amidohydrolase